MYFYIGNSCIFKIQNDKKQTKISEEINEAESKYNATFVDFIQNIIAVRKLNISKFCNDKIMEN